MNSLLVARAVSLALATVWCTAVSVAQQWNGCRSDCDTIPYSAPQRTVVRLANGCFVRVTWNKRPGCTVGIDVSIASIEPLTDDCGRANVADIVNETTDSLIAARETGYYHMAAPRDTCVIVGHVYRAACWGYRVDCGDTIITPCDTTSCCESSVMLCTDEIFRRSIRRSNSVLRIPCNPNRECAPVCGSRLNPGGRPPDSLAPTDDDVGTVSMAVHQHGERAVTQDVCNRLTPWPWRDPRHVRDPVRSVFDERRSLAIAIDANRNHATRSHSTAPR